MDLVTVTSAYSGLKAAKDMLQALAGAKIDADSLGRINEALGKLGQAQDSLFELREELFSLQQSNQELVRRLADQDDWMGRLANYALVTTSGGATVYEFKGEPKHFVCPCCINKRELQILQDTRSSSGRYSCSGCKEQYPVRPRRDPNISYPSYGIT